MLTDVPMGSTTQSEVLNETKEKRSNSNEIVKDAERKETKRERWEGLVKIKGGFLSLFKERYMVLDRDSLVFYKAKKPKKTKETNKAEVLRISLRNAIVSLPDDSRTSPNTFTVMSFMKKYQIQSEDSQAWINGIEIAIQRASSDCFTILPEEMALSVFLHLTSDDLRKVACVCKKFNEWSKHNVFWRNWFQMRNPTVSVTDRDLEFLGVGWRWLAMCTRIDSLAGFSGLGSTTTCFGEFLNGTLHGRTITLFDNAKYVGYCNNGLKDGRGFLTFTKGEKIDGEFKNGKLVSGTLIRANGNKYEGEFKNSKYDGKGILTKVNGKRYEGEFRNGSRNGKGIFTFPDGSKYEGMTSTYCYLTFEGEFKNGKYEGRGIYYNVKGSKFEGSFKAGRYDGYGIYVNTSKKYTYEGEFRNGKFHGRGILINEAKGSRYEGEFKHGWSDGKGTYIGLDGSKYIGDFKRGKYHGHGVYIRSNGSQYNGDFQNGRFEGKGTFISTSNKRYEGTFKNGKRVPSLTRVSSLDKQDSFTADEEALSATTLEVDV